MIKRFPSSRTQRSKGVKIKHVLQVILLLGVCIWLIYQVKHNHDKKKEFDKNDSILSSVRTETDKVVKLGRKDLHPVKDEVDPNGKHEEEEDEPVVEDAENKHEHVEQEEEVEGNKHETEEGREEHDEEEKKHGTEEQEEGENKAEEIEDEDVEVDENDHEKSDVDNDQDDEDADELKDKVEDSDETENEDKEDEEKEGSVENHENHEAREEHYKGDDASSAVAHDTQTTSTETEAINLTQAGLSVQMNIEQTDNTTSFHSDENNRNQYDSDLKDREGEAADAISSNVTAGNKTGNNSLSTETAETNTDSHLDVSNLTAVVTEASSNSTGTGGDTSSSSEQIKAVIVSESDNAQNATANRTFAGDIKQTEGLEQSGNKTSEGKLPDNDESVSVKSDNRDAAPQQSPTLGASALEKTINIVASNETENISGNLDKNVTTDTTESDKSKGSIESSESNKSQNTDATVDEMFKGNTQTDETDEKSDSSSANEILNSVIHDAIDLSDTQNIHEDMATARTDLDTLPDIQNGGNDGDESSAE